MKFKCKCGFEKDIPKVKYIIKEGRLVSNAFCDKCNNEMEYIKEHIGLPSDGVFKGSSKF